MNKVPTWKTEREDDMQSPYGTLYVLSYEDRRIAVIGRKLYTKDFDAQILPMGIMRTFGSLDEAKAFAMDCAKDCMSEWACRS